MTTIKLNHTGVDVVEMKAGATNSNEIHFTAKNVVFNADLKYIFAVTDLNVDCSSLPIFPPNTNDVLFTILKRRLVNGVLDPIVFGGVTQELGIEVAGKKYFDTASFLADVSGVANTFAVQQDGVGIDATQYGDLGDQAGAADYQPGDIGDGDRFLKLGFDAGARLIITGLPGFWNNFVIQFSDLAVKIFQLQDVVGDGLLDRNILSVTTANGVISTRNLFNGNALTYGGNLVTETVIGKNSVLKFCDHRLFLTVETHLPVERNIRVHNGVEQTDASIVRAPFLNLAESTIYSKGNVIVDDVALTTKSYVGRINFVKKTQPILKWNTLTSSFEQRIFRFFVFCVYNIFDAATQNFTQTKIAVPLSEFGDWDLTLRFVSKI